MAKKLIFFK